MNTVPQPAKPILKWAGGKTQMLAALRAVLPDQPWSGRYVEPFVGGGALFFAIAPERAWIADVNPELIHLYRTIVADVDGVIAALREMPNDMDVFMEIRAMSFEEARQRGDLFAAARMIYLNRTAFNGLYRQDARGRFNVPFGRYTNPRIVHEEGLRAAQAVLSRAEISCAGFEEVMAGVGAGDVVFLDPPYVPMSATAGFHHYVAGGFNASAHRRLHDAMADASARGAHVVLTNSAAPLVYDLFADMDVRTIDTRRNIAARADRRTGQDTLIVCPAHAPGLVHRQHAAIDAPPHWAAQSWEDRITIPSLGIDHGVRARWDAVTAALGDAAPIQPYEVVPYVWWSADDAATAARAILVARTHPDEVALADRAFRVAEVLSAAVAAGLVKRRVQAMALAMEQWVAAQDNIV